MTRIVILGGSFAGVSTAHRILKRVGKAGGGPVKLTLVSPNTHFYWNIAAPRVIVPGQITDEKIFQSLAAGFEQYPASQFEFIVASAKSLNVETKKVHLDISGSAGTKVLDYDFLILATGTSTKEETPFKTLGSTEATKDGLHKFQAQVRKAKTIVLAGAGPTGVEIAGELGFEYGKQKEIILIASGPAVLEAAIPGVQKIAAQLLQNLKVNMRLETKIISSAEAPDGRQILELSDGEKMIADLYIPTFGVTPNSSYVPEKYLNNNGFVVVDNYLKVKGVENVWAIGDISDREPPQFMFADKQAAHLAKNITLILSSKAPLPYKGGTRCMGLQVGRKAGTGHLGNVQFPGFLVHMLRKNLFLDNWGDCQWFCVLKLLFFAVIKIKGGTVVTGAVVAKSDDIVEAEIVINAIAFAETYLREVVEGKSGEVHSF